MMTKQEAKELKDNILNQFPTLEIEIAGFDEEDRAYLLFKHKGDYVSVSSWSREDWAQLQRWSLNFAFMSAGVL